MYVPYTFHFSSSVTKQSSSLPDWSSFVMHHAHAINHVQLNNNCEIVRQQINHTPFHLDLIQSKSPQTLSFDFEIHKEQMFLFFMVGGNLKFSEPALGKISQVKEMYYYATFNKPSVYRVACAKGNNTTLAISISPEWLEKFCSNCLNLNAMLNRLRNGEESYGLLPHCRIEKDVQKYLREINGASNENRGVFDGILRMRIAQLLAHYDGQVFEKFDQLAYRVKNYLDTNFRNPDCDNKSIALNFNVTERTLRNNFTSEFYTTPQDYLTSLRMEKAWELCKNGKSVKEVYERVGYNDERSFRYNFKKHLEKVT